MSVETEGTHDRWFVSEIFSNADGSIQFIELRTPNSGQNQIDDELITVTDGGDGEHTFIFPSAIDGPTQSKNLLLATPGFADVAGVEPDFTIPTNFLFLISGTITYTEDAWDFVAYSDLPTNGVASLRRVTTDDPLEFSPTNSPSNFAGVTGQVRANPRIVQPAIVNGEFQFTFASMAGKTYHVEATGSFSPTNWQTILSLPGTGNPITFANSAGLAERYYRLRVE